MENTFNEMVNNVKDLMTKNKNVPVFSYFNISKNLRTNKAYQVGYSSLIPPSVSDSYLIGLPISDIYYNKSALQYFYSSIPGVKIKNNEINDAITEDAILGYRKRFRQTLQDDKYLILGDVYSIDVRNNVVMSHNEEQKNFMSMINHVIPYSCIENVGFQDFNIIDNSFSSITCEYTVDNKKYTGFSFISSYEKDNILESFKQNNRYDLLINNIL